MEQSTALNDYELMQEKAKEIYSKRINFLMDVDEAELELSENVKYTTFQFHADIKTVCLKANNVITYFPAENFRIAVDKGYDPSDMRNRQISFIVGSELVIQDLYLKYVDVYQYDPNTAVVEVLEFDKNFTNILVNGQGKAYPFLSYSITETQDDRFQLTFFVNYDLNEKYPVYTCFHEDPVIILEKAKEIYEILEQKLDELHCFMTGDGIYIVNGEIFTTKKMGDGSLTIVRVDIKRKNGGEFEVELKERSMDIVNMFKNDKSAVLYKTSIDNIYYDGCMLNQEFKNSPCYLTFDDINNIIRLNEMCDEMYSLLNNPLREPELIKAKMELMDHVYEKIEELINNEVITQNLIVMYYGTTLLLSGLIAWYLKLKEWGIGTLQGKEEDEE